jgi:hypothetical protein
MSNPDATLGQQTACDEQSRGSSGYGSALGDDRALQLTMSYPQPVRSLPACRVLWSRGETLALRRRRGHRSSL